MQSGLGLASKQEDFKLLRSEKNIGDFVWVPAGAIYLLSKAQFHRIIVFHIRAEFHTIRPLLERARE